MVTTLSISLAIVISVTIASIACLKATRAAVQALSNLAALRVLVETRELPAPEDEFSDVPTPSQEVLDFCAAESDAFAREQLLRDAQALYREYEDWSDVLYRLDRTYT